MEFIILVPIVSGLALGVAFGALALATNFCAMGAITDQLLMGDGRRLRAWLLAAAVAILGTQALGLAGLVETAGSIYRGGTALVLCSLLGAVVFGFGMVLAGGCVQRALVRTGAGSRKAPVVLLAAILGAGAVALLPGLPIPDWPAKVTVPELLARHAGLAPDFAGGAAALVAGGALLAICLASRAFRTSARDLAAGIGIGGLVLGGWLATRPDGIAEGSLNFALALTAETDAFLIAAALGTVLGAVLYVAPGRRFRVERFADRADIRHTVLGGFLMGVGGALAHGGTIGQGVTGLSTLALGSILAWIGLVLGAWRGLRYLESGKLFSVVNHD
ncbi:MAG: YeeE/YedE family protein [Rhodospirillaceae bacterium]|nr:YeeE/YedE family protein [Rhodospirillaceae bacterium]MBT6119619.1 YeeE/YedE family protein [Rhodospirillaceae bacterium]